MKSGKSYPIRLLALVLMSTVGMTAACPQAKAGEAANAGIMVAACTAFSVGLYMAPKVGPVMTGFGTGACFSIGSVIAAKMSVVDSPKVATQQAPASAPEVVERALAADPNATAAGLLH